MSFTVKDKSIAPLQITAEQILREAVDKSKFLRPVKKITKQTDILDVEELRNFQLKQRKYHENAVRLNPQSLQNWLKYARFEESQREFGRCRSVMERALSVHPHAVQFWKEYILIETRNGFINHARNLYERVIALLPRVDDFWYKYAFMEESLGNVSSARLIFDRWMKWEPSINAYNLYISFESRLKNTGKIRQIYSDMCRVHCVVECWIQWAQWEMESKQVGNARAVYTNAMELLFDEYYSSDSVKLCSQFAKFESSLKEIERARFIFKYGIEDMERRISEVEQLLAQRFDEKALQLLNDYKRSLQLLQSDYVLFEQQHGDKEDIESVIILKKRQEYEQQIKDISTNSSAMLQQQDYDVWFDYINLEEGILQSLSRDVQSASSHMKQSSMVNNAQFKQVVDRCREVYERAIAQVPSSSEDKRQWRRYIYLWIKYAIFEELMVKDYDRARQVYQTCLKLIPHQHFTFAKIWLLAAKFEIRHGTLVDARKLLGKALGVHPTPKLFKGYIELELSLREFSRCRILYEKFIQHDAANVYGWCKYAELESLLGETERARGIFELGIRQEYLDMPEVLWKAYIDFEVDNILPDDVKSVDRVRALYERLLQRSSHPKVWVSLAEFEHQCLLAHDQQNDKDLTPQEKAYQNARSTFQRGCESFKQSGQSEERRLLYITWLDFEQQFYDELDVSTRVEDIRSTLQKNMPQQVKKRKRQNPDDDADYTMLEYYDYEFPEDTVVVAEAVKEDPERPSISGGTGLAALLSKAKQWKKQNA
ncbi:hypothetical protein MP228_007906 [Amoeboaphelidium protococcarum]|nr:hypothetical protein MP228_007906 [Amoeboaphelidium protococcarum]